MLKLYKQIISAVFILMVLGSCTPQIEDLFEDPALTRLEAYTDSCRSALIEAPYGWIVNYYPNNYTYGGYTFIMSFTEDGQVMMMAEEGLSFSGDTSTYRVHSGQSTVLAFDTYSEFHYFADAEATYLWEDKEYYVDFGTGYGGDFEFICKKMDDDAIYFEGLKRKSKTVFTKLKSQEEKDNYLGKQVVIHDKLETQAVDGYFLVHGGDSLEITYNNYHYFYAHYIDEIEEYSKAPLPFIVTEDGLSFYDTLNFKGADVKDFVWNETTTRFEAENGAYLNPGGTVRSDFTDPMDYQVYLINFDKSSNRFMASVDNLSENMKGAVAEPQFFTGVTAIEFIMNGYPTAQAYYNGSHRIDVYSEYALETLDNMFIFGTSAASMYSTRFNYGVAFSDGEGGTGGYTAFHSFVIDWFTKEFIQNYEYTVEEEVTWSYGEKVVSYKLSRVSDPEYFVVLRPKL